MSERVPQQTPSLSPTLPLRERERGAVEAAHDDQSRRTTVWSRPVKGPVALLVVLVVSVLALTVPATIASRVLYVMEADMQPVIETGEYIYVDVYAYRNGSAPKRGELVAFRAREIPSFEAKNGESAIFLKRVVALPGETIAIVGGKLTVNGAVPPELERLSYVVLDVPGGNLSHEGATFTVPRGTVYVLGDNSKNSYDSRFWGPVPLKALRGRAEGCVWPLARMRWY